MFVGHAKGCPGDTFRMYSKLTNSVRETKHVRWMKRMFYKPIISPPIPSVDSIDLVMRSGNVEPLRTGATQGTKPVPKQQKGAKPDKVTFQLQPTTIITNPKPVRVVQVTETQGEAMSIISQSVGQQWDNLDADQQLTVPCLLYTSPSPRDRTRSRMPSSA